MANRSVAAASCEAANDGGGGESGERQCSTNNLKNVIHENYNFTYIKNWSYYRTTLWSYCTL
jgi:hypothetical protein